LQFLKREDEPVSESAIDEMVDEMFGKYVLYDYTVLIWIMFRTLMYDINIYI